MAAAECEARNLQTISTTDGDLLLFNAHIAPDASEIVLPNAEPSHDETARFIYRISSVLPDQMMAMGQALGLAPGPQARGCVFNAGAEMLTRLIVFGSISLTNARER
jgi:hypothetical protein